MNRPREQTIIDATKAGAEAVGKLAEAAALVEAVSQLHNPQHVPRSERGPFADELLHALTRLRDAEMVAMEAMRTLGQLGEAIG